MVRYSVTRKAEKNPDYLGLRDAAELAVLADDRDDAQDRLSEAAASKCEAWMLESTAAQSRAAPPDARSPQGGPAWIGELERGLLEKAWHASRRPRRADLRYVAPAQARRWVLSARSLPVLFNTQLK